MTYTIMNPPIKVWYQMGLSPSGVDSALVIVALLGFCLDFIICT